MVTWRGVDSLQGITLITFTAATRPHWTLELLRNDNFTFSLVWTRSSDGDLVENSSFLNVTNFRPHQFHQQIFLACNTILARPEEIETKSSVLFSSGTGMLRSRLSDVLSNNCYKWPPCVNVCLIPGPSLLLHAPRRQGALRQQRGREVPHQAAPASAASTRQRSQVSFNTEAPLISDGKKFKVWLDYNCEKFVIWALGDNSLHS